MRESGCRSVLPYWAKSSFGHAGNPANGVAPPARALLCNALFTKP